MDNRDVGRSGATPPILTENQVYVEAIQKWGAESQLRQTIEECAELIVALSKALRGKEGHTTAIIEEMADVEIMLNQLNLIFGREDVLKIKGEKLDRLRRWLAAEPGSPYDAGLIQTPSGGAPL